MVGVYGRSLLEARAAAATNTSVFSATMKLVGYGLTLPAIWAQQKIGGGVTPPPVKGRPLYLLELNGSSG